MKLTIGADPELFIMDKKAKKLISAAGLFPGTKEAPHPVMHGAIQVDGMAAEYNILPASTAEEFILNHLSVLRSLRDSIKENNPDLDFDFVFKPVAEFGAEYIAEQSEVARALGCTPDYNAWEGGKPNPTPDAEMPFRTASGHIHLGWTKDQDVNDPEHLEACCMMAKQLDCYVGAKVMNIEDADGHKRRELYGKAGAFRPKSYGMEYRTPSNVWLSSTLTMKRVFEYARIAFDDLLLGSRRYEDRLYSNRVVNWINYHEKGNYDYYDGTDFTYVGYGEAKEPITLASLDKLFVKYAQYDTTGLITPEYLEEVKESLPKPRKSKKQLEIEAQPVVDIPPAEWALMVNPPAIGFAVPHIHDPADDVLRVMEWLEQLAQPAPVGDDAFGEDNLDNAV